MTDEKPPEDLPPKQGYIPRPPSQADIDLISGQQGMIEDEWAGEPAPPDATPPKVPPADKPPPG